MKMLKENQLFKEYLEFMKLINSEENHDAKKRRKKKMKKMEENKDVWVLILELNKE